MSQDLAGLPVADLRRRRDAVRDREAALSYRRRLLQAQMDIVDQLGRSSDQDLSVRIGEALADGPSAQTGSTRAMDVGPHPELDVEPLPVDVAGYDDEQRAELLARLAADEKATSIERRALLDELDALQAELVQRYRVEGVDMAALLSGDGA